MSSSSRAICLQLLNSKKRSSSARFVLETLSTLRVKRKGIIPVWILCYHVLESVKLCCLLKGVYPKSEGLHQLKRKACLIYVCSLRFYFTQSYFPGFKGSLVLRNSEECGHTSRHKVHELYAHIQARALHNKQVCGRDRGILQCCLQYNACERTTSITLPQAESIFSKQLKLSKIRSRICCLLNSKFCPLGF